MDVFVAVSMLFVGSVLTSLLIARLAVSVLEAAERALDEYVQQRIDAAIAALDDDSDLEDLPDTDLDDTDLYDDVIGEPVKEQV